MHSPITAALIAQISVRDQRGRTAPRRSGNHTRIGRGGQRSDTV